MYYEEKIINGVKMWRNKPRGKWMFFRKDLPTVVGSIVLNME